MLVFVACLKSGSKVLFLTQLRNGLFGCIMKYLCYINLCHIANAQ